MKESEEHQFPKNWRGLLSERMESAHKLKTTLSTDQYLTYCREEITLCQQEIENYGFEMFNPSGLVSYNQDLIQFFDSEVRFYEQQNKLSRKGKAGRKKLSNNVDLHIEAFIIWDQNQDYSTVNKPKAWQRYKKFSKGFPLAGRTKFYQLYQAYKKI